MVTSNSQETDKFLIHVSTLIRIFQDGDKPLSECIADFIGGVSDEEITLIDTAVMKWMRHELYGTHGRDHHASAIIETKKPIDMLRHVGEMYFRGYLKYMDAEIASFLERHGYYTDRYVMFTFLEWVVKKRPLSKVKFRLNKKPGRVIIKEKCRAGSVISEIEVSSPTNVP